MTSAPSWANIIAAAIPMRPPPTTTILDITFPRSVVLH
jgi:hypothetical protein